MSSEVKQWTILGKQVSLNCPRQHLKLIDKAVMRLQTVLAKQDKQQDDLTQVIMAALHIAYQGVVSEDRYEALHDDCTIWSGHLRQRIQRLLEK
ncbi:MAG: cell division protein ZapA [Candidatus Comchoanobacterales bacterium]